MEGGQSLTPSEGIGAKLAKAFRYVDFFKSNTVMEAVISYSLQGLWEYYLT